MEYKRKKNKDNNSKVVDTCDLHYMYFYVNMEIRLEEMNMTALSQEEVDKLFDALMAKYLPPVIEIKPSEIEKLNDFEKAIYKKKFNATLQIYVKPLETLVTNLLNSANKENYSYDVSNLSIIDRVTLFGDILTKSGFAPGQLVPRTEEEVDLLAQAINKGFDDSNLLDNETRINAAREFLQNLEEGISQGRRAA